MHVQYTTCMHGHEPVLSVLLGEPLVSWECNSSDPWGAFKAISIGASECTKTSFLTHTHTTRTPFFTTQGFIAPW